MDLLPGALDNSREGHIPGGLKRNREFLDGCVEFSSDVPEELKNLLYDPQTSGGLLISVHPEDASYLLAALRERGIAAQIVGEVVEKTTPLIKIQ